MDQQFGICSFKGQHLSEFEKNKQCRLREAIRHKNIHLVKDLVESGTPVNHYSLRFSHHTPLHLAVISRSHEIANLLLHSGANVNAINQTGDTPVILAAKVGDVSIIDLLLSYAVQNVRDAHSGLTHLHIACMRNKFSVVQRLLLMDQVGGINNAVKSESMFWAGFTPLHFAVQYGCMETVEFLLKCGADITAKDARQMTPLHLADYQRNEEMIDSILKMHKSVFKNPTNEQGLSHFHIACTRDDISMVNHFLKLGAYVNSEILSPPWRGWKPLHFATYYECPNVLDLLLKTEARLEFDSIYSLLRYPLQIGNTQMYNLISSKKAETIQMNENLQQLTDFHHACIQNDIKCIKRLPNNMLLSKINMPIWSGCSPAHLAVRCKSDIVVRFLLDSQADFMMQDTDGKTPLHIAFELRHTKIMNMITEKFNRVTQNLVDNTGLSIFHILCSTDKLEATESLLDQGVDVNTQVGHGSTLWAGFTAIHFATEFLQHQVVILLLKHNANVSIKNVLKLSPLDLLTNRLDQSHCYVEDQITISEIFITIFTSRPTEVSESTSTAITPLHALCMNYSKDLELLHEYLILYKDDINKTTNLPGSHMYNECTALHFAIQRGQFEKVMLLLENGADPLVVNSNGQTPLDCAASWLRIEENPLVIENLFSLQTPIEIYKPSHFHLACLLGFTNIVKHLLDKISIDQQLKMKFILSRNDDGETPLHSVIAGSGSKTAINEIVHILLENGSAVNARDFRFHTSLHLAVLKRNLDVIRILVSYGADVNPQNVHGQTPLHLVLKSLDQGSNRDRLLLLLKSGADINIVDERGRTGLMRTFKQRRRRLNIHETHSANDSKRCYVILLEHLNKISVIGSHIIYENREAHRQMLEAVDINPYRDEFQLFDEDDFIDKCEKELESMMAAKIDTRTTLHDILFKSPDDMVFYSDHDTLKKLVDSREFSNKFPIYGYLILLQLKIGRMRVPMLIRFEEVLSARTKIPLPLICLERIVQYLSNIDLDNFISN